MTRMASKSLHAVQAMMAVAAQDFYGYNNFVNFTQKRPPHDSKTIARRAANKRARKARKGK